MVLGLVLAAGSSTRMGRPKALLPLDGELFVTRCVRVLRDAGVDDVAVVTGTETARVRAALAASGLEARVIENPRREEGQLSSLQAGLSAASPGTRAVVVSLVDTPLATVATAAAVLDAWRRTGAPIVRPARAGRHGHPVVFDRALFGDLQQADPRQGARAVVRAHAAEAIDVAVDDEGAFQDVDTPEDYARLIGSASLEDR